MAASTRLADAIFHRLTLEFSFSRGPCAFGALAKCGRGRPAFPWLATDPPEPWSLLSDSNVISFLNASHCLLTNKKQGLLRTFAKAPRIAIKERIRHDPQYPSLSSAIEFPCQ
jgi:hypothetical protein